MSSISHSKVDCNSATFRPEGISQVQNCPVRVKGFCGRNVALLQSTVLRGVLNISTLPNCFLVTLSKLCAICSYVCEVSSVCFISITLPPMCVGVLCTTGTLEQHKRLRLKYGSGRSPRSMCAEWWGNSQSELVHTRTHTHTQIRTHTHTHTHTHKYVHTHTHTHTHTSTHFTSEDIANLRTLLASVIMCKDNETGIGNNFHTLFGVCTNIRKSCCSQNAF